MGSVAQSLTILFSSIPAAPIRGLVLTRNTIGPAPARIPGRVLYVQSISTLAFFHPSSAIKSVSYGSGSFSGTECAYCSSFGAWCQSRATRSDRSSSYGSGDAISLAHSQVPEYRCCVYCSGLQWRGWYPRVLSLLPATVLHYPTDLLTLRSIGPVDLTEGTIGGNTPVPTITDSLFKQGTISTESIGIFYQPSTSASAVSNGELTFGGIDSSKCVLILPVFEAGN